ncbi:hypothetical protein [Pseudomonas aeruginosa]|nr:hypothetical protein [Pseudomonas aeruginosa]MDE8657666.1 hypothetical protein [Pseudomonas aeruginosa]MDE8663397.1 hypothetical protein [Pseudomonas aeruginosa]HBN8432893.1 hypothetical protein [Pseudomonas aeruginosa]HBO4445838.1 hypothetical protein [Pseudomonas aeruginosa]HCE5832998.1 hypothetical protein [Pseudomonas aeruginosa]
MARPSDLESQRGFALPNGIGFGAVFAFGTAALFAFRQLSTETALLY